MLLSAACMRKRTYMAHPINPRKVAPRVFPIVVVTVISTEATQQAGEGEKKGDQRCSRPGWSLY